MLKIDLFIHILQKRLFTILVVVVVEAVILEVVVLAMVVVAIGCTGGQHRSVAMTHALAEYVRSLGYQVSENHRDMTRA